MFIYFNPPPFSALFSLCFPLNNLQIRAVLVLWFRLLCPGALWKTTESVRRKGDDCCVTKDIDPSGRTAQLSLLTHRHGLSDVAVVPSELPLNRPVETTDTKRQLTFNFLNGIPLYLCTGQTCPACW